MTAALLMGVSAGCSTQRMQLSKNDPPKNTPEERVKYGNPWAKKKPQDAEDVAASQEMAAELKEQLALAKAANKDQKPAMTGILQRAAAAEARGEFDDARAAYLEVISNEPNHVEAHHRLGVIADMNGDAQTADEHYAKAYATNPKDADLLSDMGYSYFLRGRFDAAERKLKEALEQHPYHRAAQNNLALVYGKQGNYDGALAMFRQTGTESDAQKNILALFPKGRPGGNDATTIARAENTVNPLPVTSTQPGQAPPFPAEFEGPNAHSPMPAQPAMNAASNSLAGSMQPPANRGNVTNPPPSNPWGTNDLGAAQPGVTGTSMAAKPPENVEFWKGNLGQNPPVAPNNGTGMAAAPWSNFPGAPPLPGQNPTGVNGMAANSGLPPGWPNSNINFPPTSSGTMPPTGSGDIQPANYQDWMAGANSAQPARNPMGSPEPQNPAQASRWAAQMGLGTGPGSMFPTMNSQNSGTPAWNQPSSATAPAGQNGTQWAYAEVPATGQPGMTVKSSWSTDNASGATSPWGANSAATNSSRNQPAVAPASPWNDVKSTSAWDRQWSTGNLPLGSNVPATNPANNPGGSGNFAPATFAEVPAWPGAAAVNPAPTNRPAPTTPNDWPIVNPGTGNYQPAANMASPAAPAVNNGTSGTTSVPNWPYAPSRP